MPWYRITPKSPEAKQNIVKGLRNQNYKPHVVTGKMIAVIVGKDHEGWLTSLGKDYNASVSLIKGKPSYLAVLEGRELRTKTESMPAGDNPLILEKLQHRNGKPKQVALIEPHQELTFNGVLSSLILYREQLWDRLQGLDTLITNLEGWEAGKTELDALIAQHNQRLAAIKMVMGEMKELQ